MLVATAVTARFAGMNLILDGDAASNTNLSGATRPCQSSTVRRQFHIVTNARRAKSSSPSVPSQKSVPNKGLDIPMRQQSTNTYLSFVWYS